MWDIEVARLYLPSLIRPVSPSNLAMLRSVKAIVYLRASALNSRLRY